MLYSGTKKKNFNITGVFYWCNHLDQTPFKVKK